MLTFMSVCVIVFMSNVHEENKFGTKYDAVGSLVDIDNQQVNICICLKKREPKTDMNSSKVSKKCLKYESIASTRSRNHLQRKKENVIEL